MQQQLLIVNTRRLYHIFDLMDNDRDICTIDVDACMSMCVDALQRQCTDMSRYYQYCIDTIFKDQNIPRDVFEDNPQLFIEIYMGLELGLKELYHTLLSLGCYYQRDLPYEYKERRGVSAILRRVQPLNPYERFMQRRFEHGPFADFRPHSRFV